MKNDLMVKENNNFLEEEQKRVFSSKKTDTIEDKKALFNALEECDFLLNDCVNKEITIKDFYIEEYENVNESGEVVNKYRTIIFDTDGKTYATGAYGIYNSIKKLIMVYGYPTYEKGVKVQITKKKTKNNKESLSLKLL